MNSRTVSIVSFAIVWANAEVPAAILRMNGRKWDRGYLSHSSGFESRPLQT